MSVGIFKGYKKGKLDIMILFIITLIMNFFKFCQSENKFLIFSNNYDKNITVSIEILDVIDNNNFIEDDYKILYAETHDSFIQQFYKIPDLGNLKLVIFKSFVLIL